MSTAPIFKKAVRRQAKLRLAIEGPSGCGKTWTSLCIARGLVGSGGRIALIDTERGSAALYSDAHDFDVLELHDDFSPDRYREALRAAAGAGYGVVIVDSLSHAWEAAGGIQEIVDRNKKGGNSWAGWAAGTPAYRALVDTLLQLPIHVICTMRTKSEWAENKVDGKTKYERVGTSPVMRAGIEYEFTLVCDMDLDHNLDVTKSRYSPLAGRQLRHPGAEIGVELAEWLEGGAPPEPPAAATPGHKLHRVWELLDAMGIAWTDPNRDQAVEALRQKGWGSAELEEEATRAKARRLLERSFAEALGIEPPPEDEDDGRAVAADPPAPDPEPTEGAVPTDAAQQGGGTSPASAPASSGGTDSPAPPEPGPQEPVPAVSRGSGGVPSLASEVVGDDILRAEFFTAYGIEPTPVNVTVVGALLRAAQVTDPVQLLLDADAQGRAHQMIARRFGPRRRIEAGVVAAGEKTVDDEPEPEPAIKPLDARPDGLQRWSVASHTTPGLRYVVTRSHRPSLGVSQATWSCECADFQYRGRQTGELCKHASQVWDTIKERFDAALAADDPFPKVVRRCDRCAEEWTGIGSICEACVEAELPRVPA
jgi:hypothetical protein